VSRRALLLSSVACAGACAFLALVPPGTELVRTTALVPPFGGADGRMFTVPLPDGPAGDSPTDPTGSRLSLLEDGSPLGPAHAQHATIRLDGGGAFSHWQGTLWFSTPDGSDPNTNGRRYTVAVPHALPVWLHLLAVGLAFLAGMFVASRALESATRRVPRLRGAARAILGLCGAAVLIEATAWVLTATAIARMPGSLRPWYDWLFEGGAVPGVSASASYAPHASLPYTLNPATGGDGMRRVDPLYLIRRAEPVRPRDDVRWRALVLGGSTTYGEFLDREQDTWVWRLEQLVRSRFGEDCDVVNGGVSGYTLLDNLLHYVLLLTRLEPDVVVLYVGINDVEARVFGDLRPDYANYRKPWDGSGGTFPAAPERLRSSWLFRLYYVQRHMRDVQVLHINNLVARDYPPVDTWADALARNGAGIYGSHLRDFVRLLLAQGRRVVMVPQYYRMARPFDGAFMPGVREHNDVDRAVAEEFALPFAAAIAEPGSFRDGDTFDSCHFTAAGSERMAGMLFAFLLEHGLIAPR
jgi:lysophospholipase L1-like esterase